MVDEAWRAHLASIRPDADPAEADWWDTSWAGDTPAALGFLIPRGFEAYARVLHPASDADGDDVRWAEVAQRCATTLHPQAQWRRLAGHRDLDPHGLGEEPVRWTGRDPDRGCLGKPLFGALCDVLGRHTATPQRTIVAFWVGYGVWPHAWSSPPTSQWHLFERALPDVPTLCREAPAVRWAMEAGSQTVLSVRSDGMDAERPSEDELFEMWAPHEWQSPSAWWPADHAWATSNDTDLDSTLVGGSRALVDDLLADDRLEVLPWPTDGSLWAGADDVNR